MSMNDVFSRFGKGMTLYQIEKAAAENTTKTEVETVSGEENTEAVSEDSVEITTHDVRHLANITMTDDNSYEYNGFTVISYKKDGAEYVKSVIVTDPKIKSPTGLSFIGNPIFDVTGRYGAPSSVDGNLYIYNVTFTNKDCNFSRSQFYVVVFSIDRTGNSPFLFEIAFGDINCLLLRVLTLFCCGF